MEIHCCPSGSRTNQQAATYSPKTHFSKVSKLAVFLIKDYFKIYFLCASNINLQISPAHTVFDVSGGFIMVHV